MIVDIVTIACLDELINMSDNFELLKNDDDVLLFDKDTFKHTFIVGRFKELYLEQIRA